MSIVGTWLSQLSPNLILGMFLVIEWWSKIVLLVVAVYSVSREPNYKYWCTSPRYETTIFSCRECSIHHIASIVGFLLSLAGAVKIASWVPLIVPSSKLVADMLSAFPRARVDAIGSRPMTFESLFAVHQKTTQEPPGKKDSTLCSKVTVSSRDVVLYGSGESKNI